MSYEELYDAFKKAHPLLSGEEQQNRVVKLWNEVKAEFKNPSERAAHVQQLTKDYL